MKNQKVLLMILDGWGIAEDPAVSAIDKAQVPFYRHLLAEYPHSRLLASGESVGLPPGQMGNSEVGHTNIGAGRIVYQELQRITKSIQEHEIEEKPEWKALIDYCQTNDKPLHLIGLVSDGGVHSSIVHLLGLLDILPRYNLPAVYIHCFTDGRDCDPHSAVKHLKTLQAKIKETGVGKIASVVGRYYAMDRDKRWERTKEAYDLLLYGLGETFVEPIAGIEASYKKGITDEFIKPIVITNKNVPVGTIQDGDAVLNFNFRTDRGRQITQVLTQQDFPLYDMAKLNLHYTTFTCYDDSYQGVNVLFHKTDLTQTLGQVLAENDKTQVRIAETEKYPHVTFFFNGGREEPFTGEKRIMKPSPKVATYDLKPEMSAYDIANAIIPEIENEAPDFICLNFANTDMVGHTGVMKAAIEACEAVDQCAQAVIQSALAKDYIVLVIADHGNADKMKNPDGTPHTAHTLAPVPCILVGNHVSHYKINNGVLADIAPTILSLMDVPIPEEMTGNVLVQVPFFQEIETINEAERLQTPVLA